MKNRGVSLAHQQQKPRQENMNYEELKSKRDEIDVTLKLRNGGLRAAREGMGESLIDLAYEQFDADDLVVKLIDIITNSESDSYLTDELLPVIRDFNNELNAFYIEEAKEALDDITEQIEDIEEFGEPDSRDYEYRKNGFASGADYNAWRHG